MKKIVIVALCFCFLAASAKAADQVPLADQKAKDSYSLGYQFGKTLTAQEVDVDADVVIAAVRDALTGKQPALTYDEINAAIQQLRTKVMAAQAKRFQELAEKNAEEGKTFLKDNQAKEGVKTLPDGLQYKILRDGNGPAPKATDYVNVHYRGSLLNGTEFDNSYKFGKPITIAVNGVIKGWAEALPLMKVGSKWQLFVPAELAYGSRQYGSIPPNSTLLFEVELLGITDKEALNAGLNAQDSEAAPETAAH